MHRTAQLPPEALSLAARQAWVLTTYQLRLIGISPKAQARMSPGWARLGTALHCLRRPTWHSVVAAGHLRTCGQAVLGDLAAAHDLGLCEPPRRISLWLSTGDRYAAVGWGEWSIRFRRGPRDGDNRQPRTDPVTTILDCLPELDEPAAAGLVTTALTRGVVDPGALADAVAAAARLRHRELVHQLCRTTGVESALEWLFESRVRAAHGLPAVERQHSVVPGTRSDALFRPYDVVVELDGARFHQDATRDARRDNRLFMHAGVVTLRFTWHDVVGEPCRVAAEVGQVLRRRGWRGRLLPCRRRCR